MLKEFRSKTCPTFSVKIWLAGNIQSARLFCAQYLADVGLCVTIIPAIYSYTGGEEDGFVVGLINYPRFPSDPVLIREKAISFGESLTRHLGQGSFLIEMPDEMIWFTRREGD